MRDMDPINSRAFLTEPRKPCGVAPEPPLEIDSEIDLKTHLRLGIRNAHFWFRVWNS